MKQAARTTLVVMVSMLGLMSSAIPVAASPADPTTVGELRSSLAYREDHTDVLRLYQAFFNREPDLAGAIYWIQTYEAGATVDDIAWSFSNSKEFQDTYGSSVDDRTFLTIVYSNVLGRAPDVEGFEYWLGVMADGLGQAGVVRWVAANAEFINRYPYEDLSAPLDTALLTLEDMPADWLQYEIGRSVQDGSCDRVFRFPDNSVFANFFADDGRQRSVQAMYSFVTVQEAGEYMENLRDRVEGECATWVDQGGVVNTLEIIEFPSYGDDSFAIRAEFSDPEDGYLYVDQIVHTRYGSTINSIYHGNEDAVFTGQTIQWMSVSTERLIDLAGP